MLIAVGGDLAHANDAVYLSGRIVSAHRRPIGIPFTERGEAMEAVESVSRVPHFDADPASPPHCNDAASRHPHYLAAT